MKSLGLSLNLCILYSVWCETVTHSITLTLLLCQPFYAQWYKASLRMIDQVGTCSGSKESLTRSITLSGKASDCSAEVSERQSRSCNWTEYSMMPQSSFSRSLLSYTTVCTQQQPPDHYSIYFITRAANKIMIKIQNFRKFLKKVNISVNTYSYRLPLKSLFRGTINVKQ